MTKKTQRLPINGIMRWPFWGATVVQRFAENVQQTPQAVRRYRDMERRPGVVNNHAPVQAGASVQRDGAHMSLIEVLMDLEQVDLVIEFGTQGLSQGRQRIAGDDGYRAMDLRNPTNRRLTCFFGGLMPTAPVLLRRTCLSQSYVQHLADHLAADAIGGFLE
jgi:hypothetical protein